MFAVTTKGEVCTFNANTHSNSTESSDQEFISSNDMQENEYTQEIPVMNNDAGGNIKSTTFIHPLENSFGPGGGTVDVHFEEGIQGTYEDRFDEKFRSKGARNSALFHLAF